MFKACDVTNVWETADTFCPFIARVTVASSLNTNSVIGFEFCSGSNFPSHRYGISEGHDKRHFNFPEN